MLNEHRFRSIILFNALGISLEAHAQLRSFYKRYFKCKRGLFATERLKWRQRNVHHNLFKEMYTAY